MPNRKISDLPAVATPAASDEFEANQAGASKRMTRAQLHALESGEHLVLPQVNEAATPTLGFGDGDSGMYEAVDDTLRISTVGIDRVQISGAGLKIASFSPAAELGYIGATATVPVFRFQNDGDTGIGTAAADQLSIIAGGVEVGRHQVTKTIASVSFVGSGLNDATSGGTFTGVADAAMQVKIDATGTPDTFEWSNDGGSTQEATGVAIVGGAMTLENGITITFAATTGHTNADLWNFDAEVNAQVILDPGQDFGVPEFPALAFGSGNTGFYQIADGSLRLAIGGNRKIQVTVSNISAQGSWGLDFSVPTATLPTLLPESGDADTGIGWAAADALSLIAGAIEGIRLTEASSHVIQAHEAQVGITAHTGSSQGDGPILSTYNVYDTVGSAGDAATLPGTFVVGTKIVVVNNAAANSMDVFPTSGDDAGAGTDTVVAVAAGQSAEFLAIVADATWVIVRNS